MNSVTNTCTICGNTSGNQVHHAREMQLGFRDPFDYLECGACGCLELMNVPDLARYYPDNYYSYSTVTGSTVPVSSNFLKAFKKNFINRQIARHYFGRSTALGKWLETRSSLREDYLPWIQQCKLNLKTGFHSRILDVGCGSGSLLNELRAVGFANLLGADPFIKADIDYGSGLRIVKKSVFELEETFDLIIMRHSFEHMAQPLDVLRQLRKLLRPGQHLIIDMPVVAAAWRQYGVNWAALDAPRHLHLYTPSGFIALAEKAGFVVADTLFVSNEWQFWASEQYLKDIPLKDPRSFDVDRSNKMFTPRQIAEYRAASIKLNESGDGDTACFYLH